MAGVPSRAGGGGARVLVPRFWGREGWTRGLCSLLEEAGGIGLPCTPERSVGLRAQVRNWPHRR